MKNTIYREDAIGAINGWLKLNHFPEGGAGILYLVPSADRPSVDKEYLTKLIQEAVYDGEACAKLLDLVDRPQGDVDAVDIFEREMHNLEQGYITIGEFDERIEPLRHLCYGRPQGEWIAKTENYHSHWVCSECGAWALLEYNEQMCLSNFCPNCGARMKGADDE